VMRKKLIWIVIFGLFAFLITFPHTPLFSAGADIDQAVYQYVGNTILNGHAPYSFAWDHKQPLTYFLFAIGSWLTGRTFWGVWLLEFLCLWITGFFSFSLLLKFINKTTSLIVVFAALFTIWSFSGISNPEQLALPFYIAALTFFHELVTCKSDKKNQISNSILLGISFACCFFLKQNLIAIPLAICFSYILYILFNQKWKLLINFVFMGLGFLSVTLIFLIYFIANNALKDYWNAAFVFNFIYSNTGLKERITSILDQIQILTTIPLMIIAFALWISTVCLYFLSQAHRIINWINKRFFSIICWISGLLILGFVFLKQLFRYDYSIGILDISAAVLGIMLISVGLIKMVPGFLPKLDILMANPIYDEISSRLESFKTLIPVAVISLPLMLYFNSLSGEHYRYYNTTLYPVTILLFGFIFSILNLQENNHMNRITVPILLASIGIISIYNPFSTLLMQFKNVPDQNYLKAIEYIKKTTKPTDPIYVWGIKTSIYSSANRISPTRYFYQLAAVNWQSYAERFSVIDEITSTLQIDKPVLFITTSDVDLGVSKNDCVKAAKQTGFKQPIFNFICSKYIFAQKFGDISIYQLAP
jgi:hypothetical protein